MKLLGVVAIWLFSAGIGFTSSKRVEKIKNIECSSDGKVCPNPYCSIAEKDDSVQLVSFGCDLQNPQPTVHFVIKIFHYNDTDDYLISDRNVNFCQSVDHLNQHYGKSAETSNHAFFMELTFSELMRACPYSEVKVINGSRLDLDHSLPNGKYRTSTTITDSRDAKIFEVIYYEEINSTS